MYAQVSYWALQGGMAGGRSVVEAMSVAKRAGFDGIELCVGPAGDLTPNTSEKKCREIAAAAREIGIKIGSVASGLLWETNPASNRKSVRDKALATTQKCLRVTADLGVKHMLVLTGHVDVFFDNKAEVVDYDDCYKRSVSFCKAVGRTAGKLGVYACLENVWNKFLMSPLEFKQLLSDVGNPKVGVYLDVGNIWNLGYPQHWIKILARRIKRVHTKGFKRSAGNADGFCMIGDGDVPLAESLKMLAAIGYKGPVTAEVFPGPDDTDEMAFLRKLARRVKQALPAGK